MHETWCPRHRSPQTEAPSEPLLRSASPDASLAQRAGGGAHARQLPRTPAAAARPMPQESLQLSADGRTIGRDAPGGWATAFLSHFMTSGVTTVGLIVEHLAADACIGLVTRNFPAFEQVPPQPAAPSPVIAISA
eukprot:4356891-Prymnesium_polylepis.1